MAPPSSGSPPPPQDFARRELPIDTISSGTILARIHHGGFDPLYFGSWAGNRFAGPMENFGICYLALTVECAFAETFVREASDRARDRQFVQERSFSEIVATAQLRLSSLHGSGLARVGATSAVASGPYDVARKWSRAIHDQFPRLPIVLGHGDFLVRMRRNEFGFLGLDLGQLSRRHGPASGVDGSP